MPSTLKITYVFFALGSAQASEQQMRLRSLSTNEQDMVPDICMKEMVKTKGSMCTLDVVSIIHANELKVSGHSSVNTLSASDSIEAGGKITSKELAVSDYAWVGKLGATNVEAEELKVTGHSSVKTLSTSDSIEAGGKITCKELAVSDYAWVGTL
eukprot:CAMPEP_0172597202 /NCGR_PEP_ID=MMETSP1068-20121228/17165_1 /TAXON_ID=35684 /ORGANISM="Pseudopedinella elastica, Strain CCMP716" /LENGTH=154 /DNA_ID=CAMNT_0013396619 /DNA_START=272 /DNA_END=732 /DNA_ORIENTATION=+